ncbi:MAG: hypothetical protein HQL72_04285 [Magnetococcales bacterium]|nr:hypothetical protein [Magnetococcales bacterium]
MTTQSEIATHLDLSERRVRDLLKELGLPTRNPDLDQVRIAYIRHLRGVASRHKSETGLDLTQERAKLAATQRQKTKIEVAKLRGKLVPSDEIQQTIFNLARRTRDRILLVPHRLSPSVAADTDPISVGMKMGEALREALEEISNDRMENFLPNPSEPSIPDQDSRQHAG